MCWQNLLQLAADHQDRTGIPPSGAIIAPAPTHLPDQQQPKLSGAGRRVGRLDGTASSGPRQPLTRARKRAATPPGEDGHTGQQEAADWAGMRP